MTFYDYNIDSMYGIYADQLTPQTTPTDRHIWRTASGYISCEEVEPLSEPNSTRQEQCFPVDPLPNQRASRKTLGNQVSGISAFTVIVFGQPPR